MELRGPSAHSRPHLAAVCVRWLPAGPSDTELPGTLQSTLLGFNGYGLGGGNIGPCQAPSPVAERHSDDNKSGIVEVHLRLMWVYRERRGHCTESLKYTHLRILLTNTFRSTWVVILLYNIQKTSLCFQRVVLIGYKISLSRRFFLKSFSFEKWRKCSPISINNKTIWVSESLF